MTELRAGRISLVAATAALALGILMPIGFRLAFPKDVRVASDVPRLIWIVSICILELSAVAYGFMGRRTDSGVAGMTLACGTFVILFCLFSAVIT
jgi:hypothetical protein